MFLVWWNIFSTILWAICCLIKPTDSFLLILFFIDITKNITCIYTLIFFFYFLVSFATCLVARCLFYKVIFFDTIKIFSYLWVSWDIKFDYSYSLRNSVLPWVQFAIDPASNTMIPIFKMQENTALIFTAPIKLEIQEIKILVIDSIQLFGKVM